MKTLSEICSRYSGQDCHRGTDKATIHSYVAVYESVLEPYRARGGCTVLEIGILSGDSLRMWEEYFSDGTVYGVDLNDHPLDIADLRPMIAEGTHRIVLMNAADPAQVEQHFKDVRFDVIIDDASHALTEQLAIYRNFRDKLNPGALYVIEDIDNIDANREAFLGMDPERHVEIIDRRHIKNRFDDVLVLVTDR